MEELIIRCVLFLFLTLFLGCSDPSLNGSDKIQITQLIKSETDHSGSENQFQFKNGRLARIETTSCGEVKRWIHIEYNARGQLLTESAFNRDLYSEVHTRSEFDHSGPGGVTKVNRFLIKDSGEEIQYAHEKLKRDGSNRFLQIDYYNAKDGLVKQRELEYDKGNLIYEKEYMRAVLIREIFHEYDQEINPYAKFNYLLSSILPVSDNNRIKSIFSNLDQETREVLEYDYSYSESGHPESCQVIRIADDREQRFSSKKYEYY